MRVKLFEAWLTEEEMLSWDTEASPDPNPNAVLSYANPKVDVKKHLSKTRFNLIDIITGTRTHTYKIIGTEATLKPPFVQNVDLNFKYIKKERDGAMIFGRYVKGGVEDETIPYSKVAPLLRELMAGVKEASPVTGITFYKIN